MTSLGGRGLQRQGCERKKCSNSDGFFLSRLRLFFFRLRTCGKNSFYCPWQLKSFGSQSTWIERFGTGSCHRDNGAFVHMVMGRKNWHWQAGIAWEDCSAGTEANCASSQHLRANDMTPRISTGTHYLGTMARACNSISAARTRDLTQLAGVHTKVHSLALASTAIIYCYRFFLLLSILVPVA